MFNVINLSQHFCSLNFHPDCTLAQLAAWCGTMFAGLSDETVVKFMKDFKLELSFF